MSQVYFGEFRSESDVFTNFCVSEEKSKGIEILYAHYNYEAYEGYALVIFLREGKLYEVNGAHCSCNGLDDQWEPEETSLTALMLRPNIPDDAKATLKKRFKNFMAFL